MDHSLINPNQLRHAGIQFWGNLYDKTRGLEIEIDTDMKIPLQSKGTKLMFESRVPTRYELDNCQHIDMSSKDPWDPGSVVMQSVSQRVPDKLKIDDGCYAYLDPTGENAILHSMDSTIGELKERLVSSVSMGST